MIYVFRARSKLKDYNTNRELKDRIFIINEDIDGKGIFDKDNFVHNNYDACKYYDTDVLEQKNVFLINNISFMHINIRSLRANFDAFVYLLKSLNFFFDIIALTETWLDVNSSEL